MVVGGRVPATGAGVVAGTAAGATGAGVTTGGAPGAAGADVTPGATGAADVACCTGADETPGTTGAAGELLWGEPLATGVGMRVMVDGTAVTMTG